MIYDYVKSVNVEKLDAEIRASAITVALDHVTVLGPDVTITFKASLSNSEKTLLDTLVDDHVNTPSEQVPTLVQLDQPADTNGRIMVRPTAAAAGWVFSLIPIEFSTAKLNSLHAKKPDGTSRAGISYKIYDANDAEITDAQNEGNAVKTVIDFEPPHDYEIIGGYVQQKVTPTTDMRMWVVAVPDVPEAYGGSKEMVGGVNLKFIDPTDKVNADGRVAKYMAYNATYHTNKLRLIVKHDAGIQHDLLLILEMFRP